MSHLCTTPWGWYFTNFWVGGLAHDEKMDPIISEVFLKMRGQTDLRTMKNRVNNIENQ